MFRVMLEHFLQKQVTRMPQHDGLCMVVSSTQTHSGWAHFVMPAQQCRTPLCMSVQQGQGGSPWRAHVFESGCRSTCPGLWCPLL